MDGYKGEFSLATPVEGHSAETLVQVTVSGPDSSRLMLDFSGNHRVLTDACVLLCGHIGALELINRGYTGRLVRRPRLAARDEERLPGELLRDGVDAARPNTEMMQRT